MGLYLLSKFCSYIIRILLRHDELARMYHFDPLLANFGDLIKTFNI